MAVSGERVFSRVGTGQWEFEPFTKTIHRSSYPSISPTNPANSAAGKVVLVTGGGNGIGLGIAEAFVTAGAKTVAIIGRRGNVLAEGKTKLEKTGPSQILTFQADVTDAAALKAAFEGTEKAAGKIDVVVGNAGYMSAPEPAATAAVDDWWRAFEVNIKGTLLTFQAWQGHVGTSDPTFISLNTVAAHGAFPGVSSYNASKAGQAQLVTTMANENPDIKIVTMHPGAIESEMNTKSGMPLSKEDISLPSSFAVWLAAPGNEFVKGRFLWAHWDVDELKAMAKEIQDKEELFIGLTGWPKNVGNAKVVA